MKNEIEFEYKKINDDIDPVIFIYDFLQALSIHFKGEGKLFSIEELWEAMNKNIFYNRTKNDYYKGSFEYFKDVIIRLHTYEVHENKYSIQSKKHHLSIFNPEFLQKHPQKL